MTPSPDLRLVAARGAGRALGLAVAGLARLRPAAKPMHPRGTVHRGRLHPHRARRSERSGAAFLDEPGTVDVLVRLSRSAGLPRPWPDVAGLAVRVPRTAAGGGERAWADVLMSGSGSGPLTRHLLAPTLGGHGGFVSTLVPLRSPTGPVLLGAHRVGDGLRWQLAWARPGRSWHRFADLLLEPSDDDEPVTFDPVGSAPDGLVVPPWVRAARGPGYRAARRARGDQPQDQPGPRTPGLPGSPGSPGP